MAQDDYDFQCKVVIVGDTTVGKTHLLSRLTKKSEDSGPTGFAALATQTFQLAVGGGVTVKAHLWDTPGLERYRTITSGLIKHSAGAVLVYDVTAENTFNSCSKWIEELRQRAPEIVIMLVGNKADLAEKRQVRLEDAQEFAHLHGLIHAEASALSPPLGIFEHLRQMIMTRLLGQPQDVLDVPQGSPEAANPAAEVACQKGANGAFTGSRTTGVPSMSRPESVGSVGSYQARPSAPTSMPNVATTLTGPLQGARQAPINLAGMAHGTSSALTGAVTMGLQASRMAQMAPLNGPGIPGLMPGLGGRSSISITGLPGVLPMPRLGPSMFSMPQTGTQAHAIPGVTQIVPQIIQGAVPTPRTQQPTITVLLEAVHRLSCSVDILRGEVNELRDLVYRGGSRQG